MLTFEGLLRAGGCVHLAILGVALLVPHVLKWSAELRVLSSFLRRLFWVYGGFIAYVILGFGVLSICQAPALAGGSPLGRGLCAFIALFWLGRLLVQFFVFNAPPLEHRRVLLVGYHALTLAFVLLAGAYGLAAIWPRGGEIP